MSSDRGKSGFVLTGRHVLFAFVGFFGVVFSVNAYFVNRALSTNTGVVANEPYRKGLKYNERITASERQVELGWKDSITLGEDGTRLIVELTDAASKPVTGLKLQTTIGRPATTAEDKILDLAETAPGRYETLLDLAGAGAFLASLEAQDPAKTGVDVVYRARKRLWLER